MAQFALEAARALDGRSDVAAAFSISRQNELFAEFESLGVELLPIDTFSSGPGSAAGLWRIPGLRRRLAEHVGSHKTQAVIELMPHIWSPLLMSAVQNHGARYATIVHDASKHPGDPTARLKPILDLSQRRADRVLTLSNAVAEQILQKGVVPKRRVSVLFHPDLDYASTPKRIPPSKGEPIRLLFLGRIMPYKGLPLFVDMVEHLVDRGLAVEPLVFGEGKLGVEEDRLVKLNARIVNRWLTASEIAVALGQAHAVVLSHCEASQSGVAAAAFGAGVPVVATPVGGLIEQVRDGETGVLADAVNAQALSDAVIRLVEAPKLYAAILAELEAGREARSMARFIDRAIDAAMTD